MTEQHTAPDKRSLGSVMEMITMRFTHRFVKFAALAAVVLVAGSTLGAQDSRQAQAQLKAAQQLEEVAGDLPAAIEAYRKLSTNPDRAVAAEALLRLAGCQEKQGQAGARKTYQEVIGRFPEQTGVVAEARRRMDGADGSRTRTGSDDSRTVWTVPEDVRILGPVSADGRLVPIARRGSGDLAVRDLRDGTERVIPPTPAEERARSQGHYIVGESVLSRDGRRVASRVAVSRDEGGRQVYTQLHVTEVGDRVSGSRKVTLIDGADVAPYDWTPDGRAIAVRRKVNATTQQIEIVSVPDGAVRVIKTLEWRVPGSGGAFFQVSPDDAFKGRLSPDGQSLAIEVPSGGTGSRDIVVLPVNGGPEIRAVEWTGDDILLGWSPDGSSVLFSSARGSGTLDTWRQRLDAKALAGGPELIRRNGPARPLGMTLSGALYSHDNGEEGPARCRTAPTCEVKEATFDFETGTFASPPRDVSDVFVRSNEAPRWSPDGTRLAYYARRGGRDGVIVIKNVVTGESRDLSPKIFFHDGNPHRWDWAPDGLALIAQGQDVDRKSSDGALHRIDLATGKVSLILPHLGMTWFRYLSWSADGRTLYYHREPGVPPSTPQESPYVRVAHDLSSGRETELFPDDPFAKRHGTKVYDTRRPSDEGRTIFERDTQSGVERDLLKVYSSDTRYELTSDGRFLLATTTDLATNEGLIVLCTVVDGSTRTVFRGVRGRTARVEQLARDGRSAIVSSVTLEGTTRYWWVPFDGRAPRPLDELNGVRLIEIGARDRTMELHPDGRRLAFGVAYPRTMQDRIAVLENFLSVAKR